MDKYFISETATYDDFVNTEHALIQEFANTINGAPVKHPIFGNGTVTLTQLDKLFQDIIYNVTYETGETKRYMQHAFFVFKPLAFVEQAHTDLFTAAMAKHVELAAAWTVLKNKYEAEAKAQAKKEEDLKKAEEAFQKNKEKAIKDFDDMVSEAKTRVTVTDEFYYSIGWLASHVGTISAAMPDYLESAFIKHFGDVPHRAVDSTKRTVNGFPIQWALSFKASLPGNPTVPATLTPYLSTTGNAVVKLDFIWDLVDRFGFKFGKKQDIDAIRANIPEKFIHDFEAGLTA